MKITYENYRKKNGVTYPDPKFRTIDKIVLSGSGLPTLTKYYGSDEELINLEDFNEYGWEFIVDKGKYNHRFPLDYLIDSRKEEIGYDLENIDLVSKTILPTLATSIPSGETINDITYFGTVSVGKQKLLMVDIPRGYSTAELFDTSDTIQITVQTNEETGEVIGEVEERIVDGVVIYHLPRRAAEYDEGTNIVETTMDIPKIKITLEDDEIKFSKIVWFVITTGTNEHNNISDINISYLAWEKSNNPYRKLNEYLLRNDDKAVLDSEIEVVENMGNPDIWMDMSSRTIVGNREILQHPIIDSKMKRSDSWDMYASYKKGVRCSYKDYTYVSLIDDNCSNVPTWSPSCWIMESKLLDHNVQRVFVLPQVDGETPENIYIYPSSVVVNKNSTRDFRKFSIAYDGKHIIDFGFEGTDYYFLNSDGEQIDASLAEYNAYRNNNAKTDVWLKINATSGSIDVDFKKKSGSITAQIHKAGEDEPITVNRVSEFIPYLGESYDNISFDLQTLNNGETWKIQNILKSYYRVVDGDREILDTFEMTEYPEEVSNDYVLTLSDTYDLPAEILYDIYLKAKTYKITIVEYPGFILDYIEREVAATDEASCTIKFAPRDKNFFIKEGGISVYVSFDNGNTWSRAFGSPERTLETEEVGVKTFNPINAGYPSTEIWRIRKVDSHYEIDIPKVLMDIKFKISNIYT